MALHLVAIWNCVLLGERWHALDMNDRLDAMRDAVEKAHRKATITAGCAQRCIFVAPEYAFAAKTTGAIGKAAQQAEHHTVNNLINNCERLTTHYRDMLLIPGTLAWKERVTDQWYQAWNGGFAFYRGNLLTQWQKRTGVGEVSPQDTVATPRLSFGSGVGYAQFNHAGHTFGAEICKDATDGMLPANVDVHVVVAHGAGGDAIQYRGTEYSIVADVGASDVVDRTVQHRAVRLLPAGKARYGAPLYYWTIDL